MSVFSFPRLIHFELSDEKCLESLNRVAKTTCEANLAYLGGSAAVLLLEVLLPDVLPQLGPLARHEGALLAVVRRRDVMHLELKML